MKGNLFLSPILHSTPLKTLNESAPSLENPDSQIMDNLQNKYEPLVNHMNDEINKLVS